MSNGPVCAHISVHRMIVKHPGGTQSDVWACDDCHSQFVPAWNKTFEEQDQFRKLVAKIAEGRSAEAALSALLLNREDTETRAQPR